jgi:hypothetical protein
VALAVGLLLDSRLALRRDLGVDAVEMGVGSTCCSPRS